MTVREEIFVRAVATNDPWRFFDRVFWSESSDYFGDDAADLSKQKVLDTASGDADRVESWVRNILKPIGDAGHPVKKIDAQKTAKTLSKKTFSKARLALWDELVSKGVIK